MFKTTQDQRLIFTSDARKTLVDIHRLGNRVIHYRTDKENYGASEKWAYPKEENFKLYGDCEDYCIYKYDLCIRSAIPKDVLSLVICLDSQSRGHCVLAVRTDEADFILCNQQESIMRVGMLKAKGYKFLYRQKPGKGIDEPWDILT